MTTTMSTMMNTLMKAAKPHRRIDLEADYWRFEPDFKYPLPGK